MRYTPLLPRLRLYISRRLARRAAAPATWQCRAISARLLVLILLAGCGDNDPTQPLTVQAGAPQRVQACQPVSLNGAIGGSARKVWWDSPDDPLLSVETGRGARGSFRAPSVVVETPLRLRLNAMDESEQLHSDLVEVVVTPAPSDSGLAAGMAWDCAPFRHGVASGDPLSDHVILWTRLTPAAGTNPAPVGWEIANDAQFTDVVARGTEEALAANDFTLKVDVADLSPGRTYYYRFADPAGVRSSTGRTRTAPGANVARLNFAVASCSSIYSGYFNAYRRIAERSDLDLMIHLGDYLYDFVDRDEQVRIPDPYPAEPTNLEQWRARHGYYLADPDLRRARAMHPWVMIWDNHDVEASAPNYNGGVQAFREWNPLRDPVSGPDNLIYRSASFGNLVDLTMLDVLLHRNVDTVPGTDARSILGNTQFDWLAEKLRASTAAWRIIGNQRLFGTVRINPTYAQFIDGGMRNVFDTGAWDGYPEERTRLLALLRDEHIDNNIVLSGDSHISLALDLVDQPLTPGFPSAGVELLPTSISRGNFDETLRGLGFDATLQQSVLTAIRNDTGRRNPHHVYAELTKHGYGTLDITTERVIAQFWYSDILQRTDVEEAGPALTVIRGANRWTRGS